MANAITPLLVALTNHGFHDVQDKETMDSPNAMALDSDDTHIIQPNGTAEKDAVTEIIPESLNGDAEELPDLPLATDCTYSDLRLGLWRWWRA